MENELKSCEDCAFSNLCFAFIGVADLIERCDFINSETNIEEYPEGTTCSEKDIYEVLAKSCLNYTNEDDEGDEPFEEIP